MALALGAALSVGAALLTLVVVPPLFGAGAVGLFLISAPVFLIAGPGAVAQSVLAREMDFRRLGADRGPRARREHRLDRRPRAGRIRRRRARSRAPRAGHRDRLRAGPGRAPAAARLGRSRGAGHRRIRDHLGGRRPALGAHAQHRLHDRRREARCRPGGFLLARVQPRGRVPEPDHRDHAARRAPDLFARGEHRGHACAPLPRGARALRRDHPPACAHRRDRAHARPVALRARLGARGRAHLSCSRSRASPTRCRPGSAR